MKNKVSKRKEQKGEDKRRELGVRGLMERKKYRKEKNRKAPPKLAPLFSFPWLSRLELHPHTVIHHTHNDNIISAEQREEFTKGSALTESFG